MTVYQIDDSNRPNKERIYWRIDADRRLVNIEIEADFTDKDLTEVFPLLWRKNPEVIWYNAVLHHKDKDSTGNWSWNGLLVLAEDWKSYAHGRNPKKRVAIVTTNYWIAQLVDKAIGIIFSGNVIKCFEDKSKATTWAEAGPRPEIE